MVSVCPLFIFCFTFIGPLLTSARPNDLSAGAQDLQDRPSPASLSDSAQSVGLLSLRSARSVIPVKPPPYGFPGRDGSNIHVRLKKRGVGPSDQQSTSSQGQVETKNPRPGSKFSESQPTQKPPKGGGSHPPRPPPPLAQMKDALGLVRTHLGLQIRDHDRAMTTARNLEAGHAAIIAVGQEEIIRQAMQRRPPDGGKGLRGLVFTDDERKRTHQLKQRWLSVMHARRLRDWQLHPKKAALQALDTNMALAGIAPVHRPSHDRTPPRVMNTPQPRLLGTDDPARLESFSQDWRGRHKYAASPHDLPLRASLDRKRSSAELKGAVERDHGHQRYLRKNWSSEQFETDSGNGKRLSEDDDPLATKQQALRSGKLYRGHSFAYSGEMTKENELSRMMRVKSGFVSDEHHSNRAVR